MRAAGGRRCLLFRYQFPMIVDPEALWGAGRMRLGHIGLIGLLFSVAGVAQAQDGCVTVDATRGWQLARFANPPVVVTNIYGSWTVDRALATAGWGGHQGTDAARLEPFSSYKYDQDHAFGHLLVRAENGDRTFPVRLAQGGSTGTVISVEWAELRINDSDATLVDNAGSLNVCFERYDRQPTSNASATPSTSTAQSSTTGLATADRSAWMACFNESRQSDADDAALDRRRADLRSRERALERRASGLRDERNHLSYSYNSDEFGIADRARANQIRMHEERVAAYNADLRAFNADREAHNRRIEEFNTRDAAWRSRCSAVSFQSGRELVEQYCVGGAANTAFCQSFQ